MGSWKIRTESSHIIVQNAYNGLNSELIPQLKVHYMFQKVTTPSKEASRITLPGDKADSKVRVAVSSFCHNTENTLQESKILKQTITTS